MTRPTWTAPPPFAGSSISRVPLLANLYFISTLISTIWTFGDYTPVLFVSGGAPAFSSDVLSTLGFHYALDFAAPAARRRGGAVGSCRC